LWNFLLYTAKIVFFGHTTVRQQSLWQCGFPESEVLEKVLFFGQILFADMPTNILPADIFLSANV
jgi:hypothetical protein